MAKHCSPADRLPPNSEKLEQAVLGAILQAAPSNVSEFITTYPGADRLFFDSRHRRLFQLVRDMVDGGKVIDTVTVGQAIVTLKLETDVGGLEYTSGLPEQAPSPASLTYYADQLQEVYIRRRLVETGTKITAAGYDDPDADCALEKAEREILAIRLEADSERETDIKSAVRDALGHFEAAVVNRGKMRGLSTGIPDLDRLQRGLRAGQMNVIAARPAEGKTSLALQIAERVAVDDKLSVGLFSLEMSKDEVVQRMICSRARIPSDEAEAGNLSEKQLFAIGQAAGAVAKSALHICDRGGLAIGLLQFIARRMMQRHKLNLLVVDYLQLLHGSRHENRVLELGEITGGLKALAKELHLPIIALSQLNRDYDRDRGREPRLSDLRDSGTIEQDADSVIFIHHPEQTDEDRQQVQLLVKKNRCGRLGKVKMIFNRPITRFENYTPGEPD